ncbi:hypothetical protein [Veillonella montpellierensis]|uniref:hypothetical protein n=1 Tax=Veillonella montpellierensis TaxID=187328 RepID=UPI000691AE53|nr:hypothetical protein [Veillonella montpellierensis]
MKNLLLIGILSVFFLLSAGCSSDNILDSYSFGEQVFHAGQSEITVELPYELGKNKNTTESPDGYPLDSYAGLGEHIAVYIEAKHPTATKILPDPSTITDKSVSVFQSNQGDVSQDTIDLGGVQAHKVTATFIQNNIKYSFLQYVFLDKGVLWNIVYQYQTDDEVGAGISKEIADKIKVTH